MIYPLFLIIINLYFSNDQNGIYYFIIISVKTIFFIYIFTILFDELKIII